MYLLIVTPEISFNDKLKDSNTQSPKYSTYLWEQQGKSSALACSNCAKADTSTDEREVQVQC